MLLDSTRSRFYPVAAQGRRERCHRPPVPKFRVGRNR